jgi:hypothetical protein
MTYFYDFTNHLPHALPLTESILANWQNFFWCAWIFFPSAGIFFYTPSTLRSKARVIAA